MRVEENKTENDLQRLIKRDSKGSTPHKLSRYWISLSAVGLSFSRGTRARLDGSRKAVKKLKI
jgi:hypothetical protein